MFAPYPVSLLILGPPFHTWGYFYLSLPFVFADSCLVRYPHFCSTFLLFCFFDFGALNANTLSRPLLVGIPTIYVTSMADFLTISWTCASLAHGREHRCF